MSKPLATYRLTVTVRAPEDIPHDDALRALELGDLTIAVEDGVRKAYADRDFVVDVNATAERTDQ